MGQKDSKPNAPPPDPTEVLINMKMKSKMFTREYNKALKEKAKYITKAKQTLKQGNEEGARLFLELAEQKGQESMQYLRMSHRLEVISGQIKSKTKSMELMDSLNQFTPFLQATADSMPLEQLHLNMQRFSNAYDDLTVKGHIMDEGINKTLGEKNSISDTNAMMNALKAEVAFEMTGEVQLQEGAQKQDIGLQQQIKQPQQQQQQPQQQNDNDDFYAQLKNL